MHGSDFSAVYPSDSTKSTLRAEVWSPPGHPDQVVSTMVKTFNKSEADNFLETHLHQLASDVSEGVAKFYESILVQGRLSIRMECGELGSLLDQLSLRAKAKDFYAPQTLLEMCITMIRTLTSIQEARITHRRIDVTNWILTRNEQVKLIDFGHAKLIQETETTAGHTIRGLEMYLSPQVRAKALSQQEILVNIFKEDVWALGKVMYEMATLKVFRYLNTIPKDVMIADITRKCMGHGYDQLVNPILAMLEWDYRARPKASEALSLLLAQGNHPENMLFLEENESSTREKSDCSPKKRGDKGRTQAGDSSEPTTELADSDLSFTCECCERTSRDFIQKQTCEHKVCYSCRSQSSNCPVCSQKITFPITRKHAEIRLEEGLRLNQSQVYEKTCPFCSYRGKFSVSATPVVCAHCKLTFS